MPGGPGGRRGKDVDALAVKIQKICSHPGGVPEESRQTCGAQGKDDECCNGSRGIGSASDVKRDGGGSDWGVRRRRH